MTTSIDLFNHSASETSILGGNFVWDETSQLMVFYTAQESSLGFVDESLQTAAE